MAIYHDIGDCTVTVCSIILIIDKYNISEPGDSYFHEYKIKYNKCSTIKNVLGE